MKSMSAAALRHQLASAWLQSCLCTTSSAGTFSFPLPRLLSHHTALNAAATAHPSSQDPGKGLSLPATATAPGSEALAVTWSSFLHTLHQKGYSLELDILSNTHDPSTDLKQRQHIRTALARFSRAHPHLLQALPHDQVSLLAQLDVLPRDYQDKNLSKASRRLRQSFSPAHQAGAAGQGAAAEPPLGAATLQDLMRLVHDWVSAPAEAVQQSAPGAAPLVQGLLVRLAAAMTQTVQPQVPQRPAGAGPWSPQQRPRAPQGQNPWRRPEAVTSSTRPGMPSPAAAQPQPQPPYPRQPLLRSADRPGASSLSRRDSHEPHISAHSAAPGDDVPAAVLGGASGGTAGAAGGSTSARAQAEQQEPPSSSWRLRPWLPGPVNGLDEAATGRGGNGMQQQQQQRQQERRQRHHQAEEVLQRFLDNFPPTPATSAPISSEGSSSNPPPLDRRGSPSQEKESKTGTSSRRRGRDQGNEDEEEVDLAGEYVGVLDVNQPEARQQFRDFYVQAPGVDDAEGMQRHQVHSEEEEEEIEGEQTRWRRWQSVGAHSRRRGAVGPGRRRGQESSPPA